MQGCPSTFVCQGPQTETAPTPINTKGQVNRGASRQHDAALRRTNVRSSTDEPRDRTVKKRRQTQEWVPLESMNGSPITGKTMEQPPGRRSE